MLGYPDLLFAGNLAQPQERLAFVGSNSNTPNGFEVGATHTYDN